MTENLALKVLLENHQHSLSLYGEKKHLGLYAINNSFCVPQIKENHTSFERHEGG